VLNVEVVSTSVGVGDIITDAGFISGVDPQPIGTGLVLDIDPPSVELVLMPEYNTVFGDERTENSADDRPVPELSRRDKVLLQRALAEHAPELPDCQDFNHAHRVVANGLQFDDSVSLINHDNVIIYRRVLYLRPWKQ
jgi:hypothetical protein